jgi:hypothetical protein
LWGRSVEAQSSQALPVIPPDSGIHENPIDVGGGREVLDCNGVLERHALESVSRLALGSKSREIAVARVSNSSNARPLWSRRVRRAEPLIGDTEWFSQRGEKAYVGAVGVSEKPSTTTPPRSALQLAVICRYA